MKASGSTRCSRWVSSSNTQQRLYYHNGQRAEYIDLTSDEKKLVKEEKKQIAKELYKKLKDKKTTQTIDNGQIITIKYTSHGLDHFANDAMISLSGKYFSRNSMMRINEILEHSIYVPTPHGLSHTRTDGRNLWFKYSDNEGRGVYFHVCWNNKLKTHELYSVTDVI